MPPTHIPVPGTRNRASRRGAVDLAAVALIVLVLGLGGVVWKTSRLRLFDRGPSASEIQKGLGKLDINQAAIDEAVAAALAAERAARGEQDAQVRTGQTFVAGAGSALAAAGPAAKADPAVQLAGRLSAKAGAALESAVGPLTKEQADWVAKLIADALSTSAERRAAAERALATAEQQLLASQARETEHLRAAAAAQAELGQLRVAQDKLQTALQETLAEKDRVSGLLDTVLRWALYLAIGYAVAMWVLPLVGTVFPIMRPVATAVHAVVAPLGAKALSEARGLARDASAALHNVLAKVEERSPSIVAEVRQVKADWVTEADGTAARYDSALREAQQL